jgi:nicotinamide-nucleotide amidase
MRAEVIAIGDELTSGQRLDTNSQWISCRLAEIGIPVVLHAAVPDDLAAMTDLFCQTAARSDLAIITGGLGPTADDLTREALAAASHTELVTDEVSLRHIEELFVRRGREMPDRNRMQAMFPKGSRAIPNPHGTAPGIDMEITTHGRHRCRFFALPGVPAEMHEMWHTSVSPAVAQLSGTPQVIIHRRIKCFGAGESQIEAMLPDLIQRGRQPSVGITAHAATITLRITAAGSSREHCEAMISPTAETIRQCLGDLVFGDEDDELQDSVLRILARSGHTLATAESGTSGRLAHWLSEARDSAGTYLGGLVSVDNTSESDRLGGEERTKKEAVACRQHFNADYGLAVGPIPVGKVDGEKAEVFFMALATPDDVLVQSSSTAGHPDILRDRAAKQALNLLRLHLFGV